MIGRTVQILRGGVNRQSTILPNGTIGEVCGADGKNLVVRFSTFPWLISISEADFATGRVIWNPTIPVTMWTRKDNEVISKKEYTDITILPDDDLNNGVRNLLSVANVNSVVVKRGPRETEIEIEFEKLEPTHAAYAHVVENKA